MIGAIWQHSQSDAVDVLGRIHSPESHVWSVCWYSQSQYRDDRRRDDDVGAEHAALRINRAARGDQTEEHQIVPPGHVILDLSFFGAVRRHSISLPASLACLRHVAVRACSPARSHHSSTHVSIAPGPLRQRQHASPPDSIYEVPVTGNPLEDGNPPLRQLLPQSRHLLVLREM